MKPQLNMDKIAKRLGGERRHTVRATSGYFGAMQLLAELEDRFQDEAKKPVARPNAAASGGRKTGRR